MRSSRALIAGVVILAGALLGSSADASLIGPGFTPVQHVTDGQFTGDEWGADTNAAKSFFPVVGDAGGAWLYVAQGSVVGQTDNLYLMYDWINSPNLGMNPLSVSTFFDVFFQVQNSDYVAHFGTTPDSTSSTGFDQVAPLIYEKSQSVVSPVNPDGSFNLSTPPWTLLNPPGGPNDPDFTNGNFDSAIGFGTSPNSATDHLMGELQMTINTTPFTGLPSTGLYSPEPAFWSASGSSSGSLNGIGGVATVDPPITSGIFTLNPDGTTTLNPLFGFDGAPVLQPQDLTPEPSSLALVGMAGASLLGYARKRRKSA